MPKVKQQTAAKIGLFTAVMMIFGTLVGIGIFFKNYSVFNNNHGNPIGILLSWVVAIVLVMCIGLSFCEISSCKIKNVADGFGGWSERFLNHGFGRYNKLGYSLIFYTVNCFAIMFFTGEGCLNCFANLGVSGGAGSFDFGPLTTLYVFLAAGGLFALFIFLNVMSSKGMARFSNITGIIKFVPIAAVIILGIVFGLMNNKAGLWNGEWYKTQIEIWDKPNIVGIITSVPSILFAFEGYLVVGNLSADMKKPEKNVPLSMIIALIIVSTLYLVITIGCMTAGTGNVYQLMEICFGEGTQLNNIFTNILSVFIFICIIGVLNAITFTGMRAFQASCEQGVLFKGKQLVAKKPNNKLFAGGVWFAIAVGVWWVATLIPSAILNTDQIVDACSYIMIIGLYVMYVIVMIPALLNRKTKKVEVRKTKVFIPTCIISLLGCSFIIIFCGFYKFLAIPIDQGLKEGWNKIYYECGWGLFVNNASNTGFKLNYWHSIVVYWSIFIFMLAMPFVNDLLIKWFDKKNHQQLIWQKQPKNYAFN